MGNTLTKEAKVKIGFDIDKETAKKAMADTAKEAERLEKAIGKVTDRYKGVKEEFSTNKSAAITGTLGAITKAASGVSDEVGRMLAGFSVVTGIVDMFNSLNGSINNSVKALREMKAVGATLTTLQGISYAGGTAPGVAGGAVAGMARGTGTSIAGAAAGGALVSAAGQFATSSATAQVRGALEKAAEKLSDKASDKAGKLFDSIINHIVSKSRKTGSALVPSSGGGVSGSSGFADVTDAKWSFNTQRLIGRDQTTGEYVRDAMMNAGLSGSPSSVPMSGFGRFLQGAQTSFYSPKNRINFAQGGLTGGLLGAVAGYGLSGGSGEGAAAGGGIGAVVGSVGNALSSGAMVKGLAGALATPLGAALAGAGAIAISIFAVKGGKLADKFADNIAGWFLSFVENGADKALKRLNAKRAEIARRENVDSVTISINTARREALEGVRGEQISMALHQEAVRNGTAGAGLESSIGFAGQNVGDANSRLIQAQTARLRGDLGRGGDPAALRARENEALGDFHSQMAAQRQLTDARAAGQLAMIDPEIARARAQNSGDTNRLAWMKSQQAKVDAGQIKSGDRGFTDVAMAAQYEKAEQSTRRLIELEKQRGEIKRSTLEVQKQEFAVYREQVRAGEQAARQALAEKEGMIEAAKQEFATMGEIERGNVLNLAKKLKKGGIESLTDDEKQYAMSKQSIFGAALKPQLSKLGDKVGFSDLQALVGLDTKKETDALKQAQNLKVDVERNITAQLQLSEEKLGEELASKFGPLFKSLTIILESKFEQMLRQSLNKIGGNIQDGNMQK